MFDNLLRVLPLLTSLTGTDCAENVLALMFRNQDRFLSKLHLTTSLEHDQLVDIQTQCPNLEDIQVGIGRSLGDMHEVQLYRALGSLPKLSHLILLLNMTHIGLGDSSDDNNYDLDDYDHFSVSDQMQVIRNTLTNSAVDANLARGIFNVILNANRAVQSDAILSFTSLRVFTLRWGKVYASYPRLGRWLSKSWKCERTCVDMNSNGVWIEQFGVQKNEMANFDFHNHSSSKCEDHRRFRQVWEEVWPEAKGEED